MLIINYTLIGLAIIRRKLQYNEFDTNSNHDAFTDYVCIYYYQILSFCLKNHNYGFNTLSLDLYKWLYTR